MQPEIPLRDPLTGVYSRASFDDRLQQEVERAQRYQQHLVLLLLDVDHFKSVNDAFGHARGDQVLVEFAQRLQDTSRATDLIFRYGGDEFVLLLPHTDMSQAAALAQRILERMRTTPFAGEPPLSLSLSVGIAGLPQDGQTPEALFEVADQRHYAAKRAGRGRVISADPAPDSILPLEELSRLLERDQALEVVRRFLETLPEHRHGVLRVAGPPGSGRTRFLVEVAKNAALHGYTVLTLRGTAALRNRLYGALSVAVQSWDGLPAPMGNVARWIDAMQQWLPENGRAGLLVTLDNPGGVDRASLELLRELLFSAELPPIALAHTLDGAGAQRGLLAEMPFQETVTLAPLSQAGVRIWVRRSLQWEAPPHFLEWFHQETGGLPTHIRRGLAYLLEENVLQATAEGWRYRPDFSALPLASELTRQAGGAPSNLPGGLLEFVGREAELQAAKGLIQECGLVTLLGPGGIGKSRLAVQAAAESLDAFPDGVYFAPLARLSTAEFLAPAIAEALHFSFSGREEPKTQLLDYLRAKALLLVLDNFEHVLEGAALLNEIQEQAPGVKLLVTSRERLHLPGETVYELRRGLGCPDNGAGGVSVEASAAGQLFLQRGRRVQPDFALSPENRADVARICRLVAGMPLGVELAAAWVGVFSPQAIAARAQIEHGLGLAQAASARRLEAEGLLLLGQANLYKPDYAQARKYLQRALRLCRERGDRRTEANALDLLGVCAQQQGDYKAARGYYEQSLRLSHEIGNRGDEVATLLRLGMVASERDDYLTAQGYLERCLRMAREFGDRWSESVAFNCLGVIAANVGDYASALGYFEQYLQLAREMGHKRHFGIALLNLGETAVDLDEYAEAVTYCDQALRIFCEIGDQRMEGSTRHVIGSLALRLGDYAGAGEAYERALNIAREIDDRPAVGQTLVKLGLLAHYEGDDTTAAKYSQQALHLFQEIGERFNQAYAFTYLGHAQFGLGQLEEAAEAYREALALRRELEQPHLATEALAGLARVALVQDELAAALTHVEEILGHLETDPALGGTDEPLRVYLTCYRVLQANREARAPQVLRSAHTLLHEWATKIEDEQRRRAFLENVPAHREIVAAWGAEGAAST